MTRIHKASSLACIFAVVILAAACAPKRMKMAGAEAIDMSRYRSVWVRVEGHEDADLPTDAKARMTEWIEGVFSPSRIGALPLAVTHDWGKDVLVLKVVVTKYGFGSATGSQVLDVLSSSEAFDIIGDFFLQDGEAGEVLVQESVWFRWERGGTYSSPIRPQHVELKFVEILLDGMKKLDWSQAGRMPPAAP